jgi:O-glycosyl hydrolase
VQNPDGSRVLVLTNRSQEQSHDRHVQCVLQDKTLELQLPANTITTLIL